MNYKLEIIERRLNQVRKIKNKYDRNSLEYVVFDNLEEIYMLLIDLYKKK
ncbi:MAG: hypothetical protein QW228_09340 [Candidatus Aenigmatarchaeota archaeon]